MKQQGKSIIGDIVSVDNYTVDWHTVKLHPAIFYRRIDDFKKTLEQVSGFYAELDMGSHIYIRFSDKDDVTLFYKLHHEYI